jgi:ribonuclease HI
MPYYAVKRGKKPGVYTSWEDTQKQVHCFNKPIFKRFETIQEAQDFVGINQKTQSIINFFPINLIITISICF